MKRNRKERILAILCSIAVMLTPSTALAASAEVQGAPANEKEIQEQLGKIDRPDQSANVETQIGETKPKNKDSGEKNPVLYPGTKPEKIDYFDVIFDEEHSLFKLTFEIQDNLDGREFDKVVRDAKGNVIGLSNQEVTIDLTDALRALNRWANEQGHRDYAGLQPGDVVPFEIYITSKSGHTYIYKDKSFILATPDMEKLKTDDDQIHNQIGAFDGQIILDRFSNLTTKKMGFESKSMKQLLKDAGITLGMSYQMTIDNYETLIGFLKSKYPDPSLTPSQRIEKYLVEYYCTHPDYGVGKDETEDNLKELTAKHMSIMEDLYTTGTNHDFQVDIGSESSFHVDAIVALNDDCSKGVDVLKKYLKQIYEDAGKTQTQINNMMNQTNYSGVRNQVKNAFGSTDPLYTGLNGNFKDVIFIYDRVNGAGSANKALIDTLAPGGIVKLYTADGKETSDPAKVKWLKIENEFSSHTLYDNFYNNVISVAYGEDNIKDLAGEITNQYIVHADKKFYMANGATSSQFDFYAFLLERGDIEADDLYGLYRDPKTGEITTLILTENAISRDEEGAPYYMDGEKRVYMEKIDKHFSHLEVDSKEGDDSWVSRKDANLTVSDYMVSMLTETGAWADANKFFRQLLEGGISKEEATWVAFEMAVNVDGVNAGNGYQNTQWPWYNSIKLERVDGEFHLVKTDENENVIGDDEGEEETSFYIWYQEDVDVDGDGTLDSYYYTKDAEGNIGFVKYDKSNRTLDYTISTVNGKLDIDNAMLETLVYYMQEAVAPKGYKLDTNIYIICNEDSYKQLLDGRSSIKITNVANPNKKTRTATGIWTGQGIDSENPVNITVVNKKATVKPGKDPHKNDNPGDGIVQTGDSTDVTIYALLLLASILCIVLVLVLRARAAGRRA